MKKKYILSILLSASMAFYSCENNEVEPTDNASLVELALLAAANDGTGTTTTTLTKSKGGCNLSQVAVADLPSAVTAYITANYADATIERAGQVAAGGYLVHLKKADGTNAGLVFDASNTFVSEKAHPKNHGTAVAVADLPAAITDYVTSNYSGGAIVKAIKNDSGNYVVVVKKSDESMVGVAFGTDGTYTGEVTVKAKNGGRHGKKRR